MQFNDCFKTGLSHFLLTQLKVKNTFQLVLKISPPNRTAVNQMNQKTENEIEFYQAKLAQFHCF